MQNKLQYLFLLIIALLGHRSLGQPPATITYVLSMPEPQTHYFEVEMRLTGVDKATSLKKNGYIDLKMPVWTPGSYLIREYAKHVEGFSAATATGQPIRSEKIRKNTWRLYTTDENLTVRYKVYAYELTVRTSFVDDSHGYVNGASMFLYHDALKNQPLQLVIQPYKGWHTVSVALPATGRFTYEAPNFDVLVDSPIEIGTHRTFTFTAAGIPHTVAQYGDVTYNEKQLAADYKKVCETAATVIGEHPCSTYTFLVHHIPSPTGGLEHQNSTTLQTTRAAYDNERNYKGFLSLVAHEYFHLWNVKRIRPIALGPFDYENENYTRALWIAEGLTSFYGSYILRRAGIHSADHYQTIIAGDINSLENQPGSRYQSVAESSFDAWIKNYRPNENSANSTISYYTKGNVLGNLLNLSLIASTNGERNLDDVMRLLYNDYYKKQKRGFTDEEFKKAVEQIGGKNMDEFFAKYVNGLDPIDYNTFFEPVGLRLVNNAAPVQDGFLGAATSSVGSRISITGVRRGSAAWNDGLNVGDEILALDSVRVGDDLLRMLAGRQVGETIRVLVNRSGLLREIPVKLTQNPLVAYRLEAVANPTEKQRALYRKWLYIK